MWLLTGNKMPGRPISMGIITKLVAKFHNIMSQFQSHLNGCAIEIAVTVKPSERRGND